MAEAKTIDSLGQEESVRYAVDQALLEQEKDFLESSKLWGLAAAISVTAPYETDEFNILYNTRAKRKPWAGFSSPFLENLKVSRIFASQVFPSHGTLMSLEELREKLPKNSDPKIKELLDCMIQLEEDFSHIFNRRLQFQKG